MRSLSRVASLLLGSCLARGRHGFLLGLCGLLLWNACRQSSSDEAAGIVDGFWEGVCLENGETGSQRIQYLFQDGSRVERFVNFYLGQDCSDLIGQVRFSGQYKLMSGREELDYAIDMNIDSVEALPLSEEGAALWNESSFCAISDWRAETLRDIALLRKDGCPSFGFSSLYYRDLIRIEKSAGRLTFASDFNIGVDRPEQIDLDRPAGQFSSSGH